MIPKERAKELRQKFYSFVAVENGITCVLRAKFLAITCVKEIIQEYEDNICYCGYDYDHEMWNDKKDYWVQVLNELEKL